VPIDGFIIVGADEETAAEEDCCVNEIFDVAVVLGVFEVCVAADCVETVAGEGSID
jgi:hypothetical protein